jgi:hypothetical protein
MSPKPKLHKNEPASTLTKMEPSQINIINNSDDDRLHLAIYQKPLDGGIPQTVAWRVASLSVGATAYLPIPVCYAIQLTYQAAGLSYKSRCAPITDYRGTFHVTGDDGCVLLNDATEPPADNHVVVTADANIRPQTIGACVVLGGDPVYGPLYLHPNTMVHFGIRPGLFYLAKVESGLSNGSILDTEALTATEVALRPNQTVTITGDKESGYSITLKDGLDSAECGC